jgi:glycosyltransferase involved in cell wall biosynthesis
MNILYIAYPLLTVSAESAGGAEQVLWTLEREMSRRGNHTAVAASAGSTVSGELLSTGEPCAQLDDFERRNREHQEKVVAFIRRHGRHFGLIHDMSGSFWPRAAEVDLPVLATLHLPRSFYPARSFENVAPNVSFNCVSNSQALSFADLENMLGVVPNGIALDYFARPDAVRTRQRKGLLWLGRICEEKAPHLALEIAAGTGLPITLAGQVYPFSYHQQYFEREIVTRLRQRPGAVFVGSPSFQQKRVLLGEAQAVLITSQVAETSSLVAMEAAASGTPVIAYRRGALPEVVQDQITGFLIDSVEEAAAACARLSTISPEACRNHAQENFNSAKMADGYAELYTRVLAACGATAVQS